MEEISSLFVTHDVVLYKHAPMFGKTSVATLYAHHLNRIYQKNGNAIILSFSLLTFLFNGDSWNFATQFNKFVAGYSEPRLTWSSLIELAKSRKDIKVFLIVDEAHLLYRPKSPSNKQVRPDSAHGRATFWNLIKDLRTFGNIKVLLFSAYGSTVQHAEFATPVEIPTDSIFRLPAVTDSDVLEYVKKNLVLYIYTLFLFNRSCLENWIRLQQDSISNFGFGWKSYRAYI